MFEPIVGPEPILILSGAQGSTDYGVKFSPRFFKGANGCLEWRITDGLLDNVGRHCGNEPPLVSIFLFEESATDVFFAKVVQVGTLGGMNSDTVWGWRQRGFLSASKVIGNFFGLLDRPRVVLRYKFNFLPDD